VTTLAARIARLAGAICVAVAPIVTAPAAAAVAPPPIDHSLLPRPASPAPPRRTEQQGQCLRAAPHTSETPAGGQLENLGLPEVWRLTRGAGQTVAVIDTGVSRHRLLPHLVAGGDYVSTGDGTDDCDGHGTVVAGIIGAASDAASGAFSGVAPDATIIGIRQSSNRFRATNDPSAGGFGDVDTLAMAVRTAADMGATVINVSSVACVAAAEPLDDRVLGAALSYAVDVKNVVVVAAAGNVGASGQCRDQNPLSDPAHPGRPDWTNLNAVVSPGWYDEYVLTVGSVDAHGVASRFSLAGPWLDVAAPGEGVVSLDPDGEGLVDTLSNGDTEAPIMGTSYAAPIVTGLVALVRSRSPELTARQVMARIKDSAHRPSAGWDPAVGYGVVDALAAVTGGPARPAQRDARPAPRTSDPAPPTDDDSAGRFAVRGAAICVAVTIAVVAMTASRRSRTDGVPHD
jgi:membrane-anchored mycosin MYCP